MSSPAAQPVSRKRTTPSHAVVGPTKSAAKVDHALDSGVLAITRRAVEVIGDEEEALRWMGTPIRALNYKTPISMLRDRKGTAAVQTVLGRLEHGVP